MEHMSRKNDNYKKMLTQLIHKSGQKKNRTSSNEATASKKPRPGTIYRQPSRESDRIDSMKNMTKMEISIPFGMGETFDPTI